MSTDKRRRKLDWLDYATYGVISFGVVLMVALLFLAAVEYSISRAYMKHLREWSQQPWPAQTNK